MLKNLNDLFSTNVPVLADYVKEENEKKLLSGMSLFGANSPALVDYAYDIARKYNLENREVFLFEDPRNIWYMIGSVFFIGFIICVCLSEGRFDLLFETSLLLNLITIFTLIHQDRIKDNITFISPKVEQVTCVPANLPSNWMPFDMEEELSTKFKWEQKEVAVRVK